MRFHARPLASLVLALSTACGSGGSEGADAGGDAPAPRAHVVASWRVRCDAAGDCAAPPARAIDASDGEGGHEVACDLRSFDGATRVLSLDAALAGGFGVHLSGVVVPLTGGRVAGDACLVEVNEPTDGDLAGACSANPPSPGAPCQVQRVTFDGASVSLEVRCVGLPALSSPTVVRELTPPESATGHATFVFTGCSGL